MITEVAMDYNLKIVRFLKEAGNGGLSVQKLSRHVYNDSNSLFETVSYEEIHRYVQAFLLRNSRKTTSLFEKTGKRGVYRLNLRSAKLRALMQQLQVPDEDNGDDGKESTIVPDLSLSLF